MHLTFKSSPMLLLRPLKRVSPFEFRMFFKGERSVENSVRALRNVYWFVLTPYCRKQVCNRSISPRDSIFPIGTHPNSFDLIQCTVIHALPCFSISHDWIASIWYDYSIQTRISPGFNKTFRRRELLIFGSQFSACN